MLLLVRLSPPLLPPLLLPSPVPSPPLLLALLLPPNRADRSARNSSLVSSFGGPGADVNAIAEVEEADVVSPTADRAARTIGTSAGPEEEVIEWEVWGEMELETMRLTSSPLSSLLLWHRCRLDAIATTGAGA